MWWLPVLFVACHAAAPKPPLRDPAGLARQILMEQFAAARRGDDPALRKTFDPDAVILAADSYRSTALTSAQWLHTPVERVGSLTDIEIHADGNVDAVWLIAQFAITVEHVTQVYRVSEVATAASGWRVVAAALAGVPKYPWPEVTLTHMEGATPRGPLVGLVEHDHRQRSGTATKMIFAGAIDEDRILADGRTTFLWWANLEPFFRGEVREVSTGGIRFLQARLKAGTQLLIVAAEVEGGSKVVLAHDFSK
jgi:hypothetical protein